MSMKFPLSNSLALHIVYNKMLQVVSNKHMLDINVNFPSILLSDTMTIITSFIIYISISTHLSNTSLAFIRYIILPQKNMFFYRNLSVIQGSLTINSWTVRCCQDWISDSGNGSESTCSTEPSCGGACC